MLNSGVRAGAFSSALAGSAGAAAGAVGPVSQRLSFPIGFLASSAAKAKESAIAKTKV